MALLTSLMTLRRPNTRVPLENHWERDMRGSTIGQTKCKTRKSISSERQQLLLLMQRRSCIHRMAKWRKRVKFKLNMSKLMEILDQASRSKGTMTGNSTKLNTDLAMLKRSCFMELKRRSCQREIMKLSHKLL